MITKNLSATTEIFFRIGLVGPTIYTGSTDPVGTPPLALADGFRYGDLYIGHGMGFEGLFVKTGANWRKLASESWVGLGYQPLDPELTALSATTTAGIYVVTGAGTSEVRAVVGVANQTLVTGGNGVIGNMTIGLALNAILPGTGALIVPKGTTVEQPVAVNGMIRFDTTTGKLMAVTSGAWNELTTASGTYQPTDVDLTALAAITTTGFLVRTGSGAAATRAITGTANQISVTNSDAVAGNPVIGIFTDPVMPGTGSITVPVGTTVQQPTAVNGKIRYDTTTNAFRGVIAATWRNLAWEPASTGFYTLTAAGTPATRTFAGTANQISISNGGGIAGDPVIALVSNAVLPGTGAVTIPLGITAEQSTPANGMLRYDTTANRLRGVISDSWDTMATLGATQTFFGACTFSGPSIFAASTFTSTSSFSGAVTFTGTSTVQQTAIGATLGPDFRLERVSATPTVGDEIGGITLVGRNSVGASITYSRMSGKILDPVLMTSELHFKTSTSGTGVLADRLILGQGLYTTNATGGDKGLDSINATSLYESGNRVRLTGKQTKFISAIDLTPRSNSGCLPMTNLNGASGKPDVMYFDYPNTSATYATFIYSFPKSWNHGAISFRVWWMHDVTTVNFGVTWFMRSVPVLDNAVTAVNLTQSALSSDTGGVGGRLYVSPESTPFTITGTTTPDCLVFFEIARGPGDAADNLAVAARLVALELFYTTTTGNDA